MLSPELLHLSTWQCQSPNCSKENASVSDSPRSFTLNHQQVFSAGSGTLTSKATSNHAPFVCSWVTPHRSPLPQSLQCIHTAVRAARWCKRPSAPSSQCLPSPRPLWKATVCAQHSSPCWPSFLPQLQEDPLQPCGLACYLSAPREWEVQEPTHGGSLSIGAPDIRSSCFAKGTALNDQRVSLKCSNANK